MSYWVATKSGREIEASESQAERVKKLKTSGLPGAVILGNDLVDATDIAGVYDAPRARKGFYYCGYGQWHPDREPCQCARTQHSIFTETGYSLDAGTLCLGKKSIQMEVHRIAVAEGETWSKLVQDKGWREKVRLSLREGGEEWCDHRAGTCVCPTV